MHQPYYKDTESGRYCLPWVRLHAVKDYLHLAEIMADFPDIHQTLNVVPSLVEQLQDYGTGRAVDPALAVSQKEKLSPADKQYLLENFFSINWDRFVWPIPRYAQLTRVREALGSKGNPATELLSDAFWRDLIVWFNLAWVDPTARAREPRLRALVEKGHDFDRSAVATVLAYHRETCAKVIPAYRRLADRGQVELSTTAYYHPILPLLVETASAQEARPEAELPRLKFAFPEDARAQLAQALAYHEQAFGTTARGIWPAEGAVSQGMLDVVAQFPNVRWLATDEHILARALGTGFDRDGFGHLNNPRALCLPYRVGSLSPAVFFRDQTLSDRIGFVYHHMDSIQAADDLVLRLLNIWQKVSTDERPRVVSIVLDGENCWEYYPNNGEEFLRALFDRLRREPRLKTVTPSEFLDRFDVAGRLPRLPTGSWIDSNLDTWIGEPGQNRAWDYLALARSRLADWERGNPLPEHPGFESRTIQARRDRARHAMLVAEGSDWFWWYYSRNHLDGVNPFDAAFRQHLANVYRAIGERVPAWLDRPIDQQSLPRWKDVGGPMPSLALSGDRQAAAGWVDAGYVEPDTSAGAMQRGATFFRRLYVGIDQKSLYLRVETVAGIDQHDLSIFVGAPGLSPRNDVVPNEIGATDTALGAGFAWKIDLVSPAGQVVTLSRAIGDETWERADAIDDAIVGDAAIELKVGLATLGLDREREVRVLATAMREGQIVETLPSRRRTTFQLSPAPDLRSPEAPPEGGRRA